MLLKIDRTFNIKDKDDLTAYTKLRGYNDTTLPLGTLCVWENDGFVRLAHEGKSTEAWALWPVDRSDVLRTIQEIRANPEAEWKAEIKHEPTPSAQGTTFQYIVTRVFADQPAKKRPQTEVKGEPLPIYTEMSLFGIF